MRAERSSVLEVIRWYVRMQNRVLKIVIGAYLMIVLAIALMFSLLWVTGCAPLYVELSPTEAKLDAGHRCFTSTEKRSSSRSP